MGFEDANTPQKYAYYNKSKAELWIQNHSKEHYVLGDFDTQRDQHSYLVKEGYQYRFVVNAIEILLKLVNIHTVLLTWEHLLRILAYQIKESSLEKNLILYCKISKVVV